MPTSHSNTLKAPSSGRTPSVTTYPTERPRVEEELRRQVTQLLEAQTMAQVGSWEWDPRTDTVLWSDELYRLLGVNRERVRTTLADVFELVHPDDRAELSAALERVTRDGGSYAQEHRIIRPDGVARWCHSRGSVLVDAEGRTLKVFGTAQDITERKEAEDALAHYAALVHSSTDAIITKSLDGRILTWNAGAERLFGYAAAEIVGQPASLILTPDGIYEQQFILNRIVRGERVEHYETVRLRKDGTTVEVAVSISPIKDARGRIIAVSSITHDITERRQAADALARSREQLRDFAGRLRSAREKERTLIAREIHDDLGQTLTALKMDLHAVAGAVTVAERAGVESKTRALVALVDALIDRVRTLATDLRPPVLDRLGLSAAVAWAAREFTRRTGIHCELDLPEQPIPIDADRATDLFRILQEALTNIVRYADATVVDIHLRTTPGEIVFEIHDNGRGISASAVAAPGSFGVLGMRERALAWGGELGIGTAPQGGTAVIVCLPLAPQGPEAAA
jgi:PAS domain S-box-containing protein